MQIQIQRGRYRSGLPIPAALLSPTPARTPRPASSVAVRGGRGPRLHTAGEIHGSVPRASCTVGRAAGEIHGSAIHVRARSTVARAAAELDGAGSTAGRDPCHGRAPRSASTAGEIHGAGELHGQARGGRAPLRRPPLLHRTPWGRPPLHRSSSPKMTQRDVWLPSGRSVLLVIGRLQALDEIASDA
ncbi:hypothetical protein EJB05_37354, partial [Eragrostis curvula]